MFWKKPPETQDQSHEEADLAPQCTCGCKTCRKPRYWLWILGFLAFYVLSVVPVGLMLYTIKNTTGFNVFKYGGYHAYLSCVKESLYIDKYR